LVLELLGNNCESYGFFSVLGMEPSLARWASSATEQQPSLSPTVVLTTASHKTKYAHGAWLKQLEYEAQSAIPSTANTHTKTNQQN
jgi:hypothetical protein